MRSRRPSVVAAASFALGAVSFGAVTTWIPEGPGQWDDPANWTNGVPTATDSAIVRWPAARLDIPAGETRGVASIGTTGRIVGGTLQTDWLRHSIDVFSNVRALGEYVRFEGFGPRVFGIVGDGLGGGDFGVFGSPRLLNANTYTGDTVAIGTFTLGSSGLPSLPYGRLLGTPRIYLPWGSTLHVTHNGSADSIDRVSDSAQLFLNGGRFVYDGADPERVGTILLSAGLSRIVAEDLTATALERAEGTLYAETWVPIRLVNPLPSGPVSAPTHRAVLPWALGYIVTGPIGGLGFMTYDAGPDPNDPTDDVGLRALHPVNEHTTTFSAGGNVRITGGTLNQPATVQTLSTFGATTLNGARLTLTNNGLFLKEYGEITGSGTITFMGHAHVWADPRGLPNPFGTRPIAVPIEAPAMTVSAPKGIIFAARNTIPGGIHLVDGLLLSDVDGAHGGATITISGGGFVARHTAQTISDVVIDGAFAHGPASVRTRATLATFESPGLTLSGGIRGRGEVEVYGNVFVNGNAQAEDLTIVMINPGPAGAEFRVNGRMSHATGGRLELHQLADLRAHLTGSGTFAGTVRSAPGVIAPGPGAARLTIHELILDGEEHPTYQRPTVRVELNGLDAGSTYDQLAIMESLWMDVAQLDVLLGFDPETGDSFRIFDNQFVGAFEGRFEGLPQLATFMANGHLLRIDYFGGDGNDVVLTAVPEPSALAATACALVALRRRKRRAR